MSTTTFADREITILPIDWASVPDVDLIPLASASALIRGRNAGQINLQVLQRYANPKIGAPAGPPGGPRVRVVLPTVYRGGRRFTTAAAVQLWKRKCDEMSGAPALAQAKARRPAKRKGPTR